MTPETALAQPQAIEVESYRKEDFPPFDKWAKHLLTDLTQQNAELWREIYSVAEMVALFIEGKQLLQRSSFGYGWRVIRVPDEAIQTVRALNVMRFYARNIQAKWVQSQGKLTTRAARDTDQAKAATRASKVVISHYQRKWFTPFFNQQEAMRAMVDNLQRQIALIESASEQTLASARWQVVDGIASLKAHLTSSAVDAQSRSAGLLHGAMTACTRALEKLDAEMNAAEKHLASLAKGRDRAGKQ